MSKRCDRYLLEETGLESDCYVDDGDELII